MIKRWRNNSLAFSVLVSQQAGSSGGFCPSPPWRSYLHLRVPAPAKSELWALEAMIQFDLRASGCQQQCWLKLSLSTVLWSVAQVFFAMVKVYIWRWGADLGTVQSFFLCSALTAQFGPFYTSLDPPLTWHHPSLELMAGWVWGSLWRTVEALCPVVWAVRTIRLTGRGAQRPPACVRLPEFQYTHQNRWMFSM